LNACGPRPPTAAEARADSDGDGIIDADDFCPSVPEDRDRCDDEDGCPELDNDHDGTPDTQDRCPNEAGPLDNQGCLPPPPPGGRYIIESSDDGCMILQQVQFDKNRTTLNEAAQEVLAVTAECLRDQHDLLVMEVRGYRARHESGLALAQQRADVAVRALIARGIDPRRLATAVGRPTELTRQHWDAGLVEFRVRRVLTCSPR